MSPRLRRRGRPRPPRGCRPARAGSPCARCRRPSSARSARGFPAGIATATSPRSGPVTTAWSPARRVRAVPALRRFDAMWPASSRPDARPAATGGSPGPARTTTLREWFAGEAAARGLDLDHRTGAGNLWAWWGDPDAAAAAGAGGRSARTSTRCPTAARTTARSASCRRLRRRRRCCGATGSRPARPIGVVGFVDEEGARFGVACAGSRLLTGALDADRARGAARRATASPWPRRWRAAGRDPADLGRDAETLRRIGTLRRAARRAGPRPGRPRPRRSASAATIWPHGRWRFDFAGEANHAGTTRMEDRQRPDARLRRDRARRPRRPPARRLRRDGRQGARRARTAPTPSRRRVTAWLDARGADDRTPVRARRRRGRATRRRPRRHAASPRSRGPPTTALRRRRWRRLAAPCSADAPVLGHRGRARRRGPRQRTASRPRCSSSATRPGSRTRPPSTPSRRLPRRRRRPWPRVARRARRRLAR